MAHLRHGVLVETAAGVGSLSAVGSGDQTQVSRLEPQA